VVSCAQSAVLYKVQHVQEPGLRKTPEEIAGHTVVRATDIPPVFILPRIAPHSVGLHHLSLFRITSKNSDLFPKEL
jgi:hypothetical protein